jgi:hypothetical protein
MNWKTGAVLLTLLAATGCGNAANNAANATGNAAGFVGNATGNVVRGAGNIIGQGANAIGNAAGQAGNAVGGTPRGGINRAGNGNVYRGSHSVQFNQATKTVDVRLSGAAAGNRGGMAWAGGTARSVNGNWAGASTITVPVGWGVRVTSPREAAWAGDVYVVRYTGTAAGVGGFAPGAATGMANGLGAGTRQGIGAAGGSHLANGQKFTPSAPGVYAIVVSGNGLVNRVVHFVNITRHEAPPSIVTADSW